jgi:hypothetical protein
MVEHNPRGTGHHVHCWQRGSYVPQVALSRMATTEGMGPVVDIRAWRQSEVPSTAYGLKAITYSFKEADGQVSAPRFLEMNGQRLSHQSRGWWTAGGARDQEREAVRDLLGSAADDWTVVKAGNAGAWLRAVQAEKVLSPTMSALPSRAGFRVAPRVAPHVGDALPI